MKKYLIPLLMIAFTLAGVFGARSASIAQEQYTEQDAIALAAESDAFAIGLEAHEGWTAAAYNTRNAYNIWRVQFWNANGEDLGWADVSPERGRVYSWESYTGASEGQKAQATPILQDFIAHEPQILELIDSPEQYDIYVDYDSWGGFWGVYIARGADSIYAVVDFEDDFEFTNPRLVRIYFEVMSYDEWVAANEDLATSKAFEQAEIAAAVNGVEGWESYVERVESAENLWKVSFMLGDQTLAQATVDLDASAIVEYQVEGQ
jgi:hypothetical protein